MAQLGINTDEYERTAPTGSPLPPGVYTMTIVRSQSKETKDKAGVFVEVEFDIQQPAQFSNRKFWDRFNIVNDNKVAEKIGREGISDLWKATGNSGMLHEDKDLIGKTVQGKLIVEESKNLQYPEPKNACRKYYKVGEDVSVADTTKKGATLATAPKTNNWGNVGTPAATTQTTQAPAEPAKAPWKS